MTMLNTSLPTVGDESSSDEECYLAAEIPDQDLKPGDYEVQDLLGNVTVVRGPLMTKEQVEEKDNIIEKLAKADARFQDHTANRQVRFSAILKRAVSYFRLPILMTSITNFTARKRPVSCSTTMSWISRTIGRDLRR